jgi:hypothetical protein
MLTWLKRIAEALPTLITVESKVNDALADGKITLGEAIGVLETALSGIGIPIKLELPEHLTDTVLYARTK